MILYLEDFSLFPEQTFRIWADINEEGLCIEKVEMCFRSGTVDVTDLLTDMEREKIRARAFEQAKEEV